MLVVCGSRTWASTCRDTQVYTGGAFTAVWMAHVGSGQKAMCTRRLSMPCGENTLEELPSGLSHRATGCELGVNKSGVCME